MDQPKELIALFERMREAKDQALWQVLYFKCQRCGEIQPIGQAVGVELPPSDGNLRYEIWCRACFELMQ